MPRAHPGAHGCMNDTDLLAGLNPEQVTAVRHETGPLMVLAGAGAGKTAVMTRRAARLVRLGHAPSRLMIVTFTNKAARELKDRCEALLGGTARELAAGTFHGLVLRHILRPAGPEGLLRALGFARPLTILDKSESDALWKAAWRDAGAVAKDHFSFVDIDLKKIKAVIGAVRAAGHDLFTGAFSSSGGLTPEGRAMGDALRIELQARRASPDPVATAAHILALWNQYHNSCLSLNTVDFDGLLTVGARLLRDHPDFARQRAGRFTHIEVDEFQDTNGVQNTIIDVLAGRHRNLAVCGDDRQAIYGFRGSDIRMMRAFSQRYPETTVVDLVRNYRSTPAIVDAANGCARAMPERLSISDMIAEKSGGGTFRPEGREYQNDFDEARDVAAEIHKTHEAGADWKTMAVLYRKRALKAALEDTLVRTRIPYAVIGDLGFFDHRDVADALALVRVLCDRDHVTGWKRILSAGGWGISAKAFTEALGPAGAWEAVSRLAAKKPKATALRELLFRVEHFSTCGPPQGLDEARLVACGPWNGIPPHDTPEYLVALWERYLLPPLKDDKERALARKFATNPGGVARRQKLLEDDIEQCAIRVRLLADLVDELRQEAASWQSVLDDLALQTDVHEADKDVVRLMTVHAAKGLEFDTVWYLGGGDCNSRDLAADDPNEERRVFYVAMTRARQRLVVTYAEERHLFGQVQFRRRSPFFLEVETRFEAVVRTLKEAVGIGRE